MKELCEARRRLVDEFPDVCIYVSCDANRFSDGYEAETYTVTLGPKFGPSDHFTGDTIEEAVQKALAGRRKAVPA